MSHLILIEDIVTPEAKRLDVSDYMISQLRNKQYDVNTAAKKVQSSFTAELQYLIDKNKSLEIIIDKLQLYEI